MRSRITNNGILDRGYVRYFTGWQFKWKAPLVGDRRAGLAGLEKIGGVVERTPAKPVDSDLSPLTNQNKLKAREIGLTRADFSRCPRIVQAYFES